RSALGEEAAASLRTVMDQSRKLKESRDLAGLDTYLRSVDVFNAALERRQLGYYLDAEVGLGPQGYRLHIASFGVERVRWYRAGAARVRVLHLARRDSLNFVHGYLGFTRPHIRDALVLLERVDAWLIETLLPALAPEGTYAFVPPGARARARLPNGLARLSMRMGQEVRRELRALAATCTLLEETGTLFDRRRAVFGE